MALQGPGIAGGGAVVTRVGMGEQAGDPESFGYKSLSSSGARSAGPATARANGPFVPKLLPDALPGRVGHFQHGAQEAHPGSAPGALPETASTEGTAEELAAVL
jgi:hypothetical protein